MTGKNGSTTVAFTVNDTETVVIGLTPGAVYNISVTAENAVSCQDMDINYRTTTSTAVTEEGGNFNTARHYITDVNPLAV